MARVSAYRETNEAPGERLHLSLALANARRTTPDGPLDELASPASLRGWLSAHGFEQPRRCGPAELTEFRLLRDAIRELLEARIEERVPERTAVAVVNRAASAAPSVSQLRWDTRGPQQVVDRPGGRGTAVARAVIAADAIELIAGDRHADLRACGAPGCLRLLLRDHPRRQWCSTRCGDRVRASRYYHRHRAG